MIKSNMWVWSCLLVAAGMVFSSSSWLIAANNTVYYSDSLKRNPVILLMPDADSVHADSTTDSSVTGNTGSAAIDYSAAQLYESLKLNKRGLKPEVLQYALKGYKNLVQNGMLKNPGIISICDYSQSSSKKRLYVINLETQEIVLNTYVAHGKASGKEYAYNFSNIPESHKSSLGFYVTANTYTGAHGLSLKINGIEKGFNDKANNRAIVIHGADYVNESFLRSNKFMGRSFGCPAVPFKDHKLLINTISDGTCLFIYHPTKSYLQRSKMLNS